MQRKGSPMLFSLARPIDNYAKDSEHEEVCSFTMLQYKGNFLSGHKQKSYSSLDSWGEL